MKKHFLQLFFGECDTTYLKKWIGGKKIQKCFYEY